MKKKLSQRGTQRRASSRSEAQWPFRADDESVLHALANHLHQDGLREFLSSSAYVELSDLAVHAQAAKAARAASTARRPTTLKVLILPGIMGSKLGYPARGRVRSLPVWIDPWRLAAGNLMQLALPNAAKLTPTGVMLFTYAKMKLMLEIEGYHADFFPYDWRLDLQELGAVLAARIEAEAAPVLLIAHSMGGLVARAAMRTLPKRKVRRLVMIGTPNFGTYAPVQALCGSYPTVRKIAMLDLKHTAEHLSKMVFSSFPGLYQMLPQARFEGELNLYDAKIWPEKLSRVDPRLLAAAANGRDCLAKPDRRMSQIVGVAQPTVIGIRRKGSGFEYQIGSAGDGTVPLNFSLLPKIPAYYIKELHGNLACNTRVIRAVIELIRSGRTQQLPMHWKIARRAVTRVTDAQLQRRFTKKIDWRRLSSAQRELLFAEFAHQNATA